MNTKTLILLAIGGVVVYMLFLKPKPQPTGVAGIVGDVGKLIGDIGSVA